MFLAPMETSLGERKLKQFEHSMGVWDRFTQETANRYGVDMGVLSEDYREERRKYFLQVAQLLVFKFVILRCGVICARIKCKC